MRKIFLVTSVVLVASFYFVLMDWRQPDFLSIRERLDSKVVWESTGLDGIRCIKLQTNEERYLKIVSELSLYDMKSYPLYDKSPANCTTVSWWNLDFPSQAHHYKRRGNGSERILSAYNDGYLYYAHEIR